MRERRTSVLRSKTLKSMEFTSGDLRSIMGSPQNRDFVGQGDIIEAFVMEEVKR